MDQQPTPYPQEREEDDDTAGHVLYGDAAQDPAGIGGRAPSVNRSNLTDVDDERRRPGLSLQ